MSTGFSRWSSTLLLTLFISGCTSYNFNQVGAGEVALKNMVVTSADTTWNQASNGFTPYLHPGSRLWTKDGMQLDQLVLVDGVSNHGTLFKSSSKEQVYPTYRTGMLPNEIVEITTASLAKLYGEETLVESSGLRPHRLNGHRAAMFDLSLKSATAPTRVGRVLSFVQDEKLYVLLFIAAEVYYFEKHWQAALSVMESATIKSQSQPSTT